MAAPAGPLNGSTEFVQRSYLTRARNHGVTAIDAIHTALLSRPGLTVLDAITGALTGQPWLPAAA